MGDSQQMDAQCPVIMQTSNSRYPDTVSASAARFLADTRRNLQSSRRWFKSHDVT